MKKTDKDEEGEEAEGKEVEGNEEQDVQINVEEDIKKLKAMRDKILLGAGEEEKRVQIKASKSIAQLRKGDKIKVDGIVLEVDAQEIIEDYGKNKEMSIDVFDAKTDRDFQIRYFSDRVAESIEFYELKGEIMYSKREISRIEW